MTCVCYYLSAAFYAEVFIWTQPESRKLGYTDQGRTYERVRLNERPVFFRYIFLFLACFQTIVHLWYDYDRVDFLTTQETTTEGGEANATTSSSTSTLIAQWTGLSHATQQKLVAIAKYAVTRSGAATVAGTISYMTYVRYQVWEWPYPSARKIWIMRVMTLGKISPNSLPPFAPLLYMCFEESVLLLFMWQFINFTFNLNMEKPPLKNGNPITNDSKDPNGSLLKGLKGKKDTIKAVALWELALITESFPDRRRTIYSEIDRKNGATHKQIVDVCLSEVRLLITRLNIGLDPNYRPKEEIQRTAHQQAISLVPQIAQPLRVAAIQGPGVSSTTTRDKFGDIANGFAKSLSSPNNGVKTREYLNKGTAEVSQQIRNVGEEVEARSSGFYAQFMASPLGSPFRHSLRRTANMIVTGAPYSRLSMLCNAITILTNLTVNSLLEDEYGRMQDEVAQIVRVFTEALVKLNEYMDELNVHWSDFETLAKPEAERKRVAEVEKVKECLRASLERILRQFGEFLTGLNLSRAEILEARKVAANGPQMAEVR